MGNLTNEYGRIITNDLYFTPIQYDADLTMDGTGQATAIATGVTRLRITNSGATTEDIRLAFGASSAAAVTALTVTGSPAAATTGMLIKPTVDSTEGYEVIGVPTTATHFAIANATGGDTQVISVTQGN